jgi:hypothetical protein
MKIVGESVGPVPHGLQKNDVEKPVPSCRGAFPKVLQSTCLSRVRDLTTLFLDTQKSITAGRFGTPACCADEKDTPVTFWKRFRRHGNSPDLFAENSIGRVAERFLQINA